MSTKNLLTRISILVPIICLLIPSFASAQTKTQQFNPLPKQWDEAIPQGNGMLGTLIWEKNDVLRFALDRADLWDSRPMKGLHRDEFSYQWVVNQRLKNDYKPVQQYFDHPYDREPAPTKIPGAALEFKFLKGLELADAHLNLDEAISEISWKNGTRLSSFVHAEKPLGWFKFENLSSDFDVELIPPTYQNAVKNSGDPVGGDDLGRLGYEQGTLSKGNNTLIYKQKGWGEFSYEVIVSWKKVDSKTIEGIWTIRSNPDAFNSNLDQKSLDEMLKSGFEQHKKRHLDWWSKFWAKSNLQVPDPILQHQWEMEQYKFGSSARENTPPISLQAVWSADNGRIPPWKGDFHHDLNTQLSYWPSYSANHLDEAMGYLNHFETNKENYKRYTKQFFGKEGIAVPGVTTLDGTEMGGWIQYSLSPTVSAWISQHYYLQWRYSMDKKFLKEKAYPWIKSTAQFLEQISVLDAETGKRKLVISSSPEINDNDISAWFTKTSNYDLSLMQYNFKVAAELANELNLKEDAKHWQEMYAQLPELALSEKKELMVTPDFPYSSSHRHFSHMMAIHPLGLVKWEDSETSKEIIQSSIKLLDNIGPKGWVGYSYSWLGNLKARAKDGEGAAKALTIFAKAFCSSNSFHVNGDQTKSGYSDAHYRPFTLEGNFAFASGLQEMLMQSHAGFLEIFPAIPASWDNVSFQTLRAEGAFLVSAEKENGKLKSLKIQSEKGGNLKIKANWGKYEYKNTSKLKVKDLGDGLIEIEFKENSAVEFWGV
ncbi:glycosyl hydrolase family 95 catalytic domain-containing protein [Daejeonella sp.]|jgi:alpha-L-fucosidase 2|uniref:glycosyl hydrolase family 95 catalytic domain-containing protein n=1 Tax=Daejeonella sp. TaxID=2805397 RepID=UPI0037BEC16A